MNEAGPPRLDPYNNIKKNKPYGRNNNKKVN